MVIVIIQFLLSECVVLIFSYVTNTLINSCISDVKSIIKFGETIPSNFVLSIYIIKICIMYLLTTCSFTKEYLCMLYDKMKLKNT